MLVNNYTAHVSPIAQMSRYCPCSFRGHDCKSPSSSPHRIKMPNANEQENKPQRNHNLENVYITTTYQCFQHSQQEQHPLKKKIKTGKLSRKTIISNKITEYFPVRRSERKSKKVVLEEHQRDLESKVRCGVEDGLEVRHFIGKGRGVIATRNFVKGEYVVEYSGELIDLATAKTRETKYSTDESTGCYMYYFNFKNKHYCIDATPETNKLGRLVNHSRYGNLVTKVVEVGHVPHLVLVAKQDIHAGTEVTYDYGDRSRESIQNHPWLAM